MSSPPIPAAEFTGQVSLILRHKAAVDALRDTLNTLAEDVASLPPGEGQHWRATLDAHLTRAQSALTSAAAYAALVKKSFDTV